MEKVTGVKKEEAVQKLEATDYDLKVAILSQIHGITPEESIDLLKENHMNIVKAMKK